MTAPTGRRCATCSDEAVEREVTRLLADATAEVRATTTTTSAATTPAPAGPATEVVSVGLVDAHVGDVLLVHAGEAIGVVRRLGVAGHATASLYPFLADGGEPDSAEAATSARLDDVRRSTVAKVQEIVRLRTEVGQADGERLAACAAAVASAVEAGGRVFTFGNGGSSTDAQALASLFRRADPTSTEPPTSAAVPAYALTADVAVVTALANDLGFEAVFARQLAAAGRPGDVAVGLSTSGNSENLLRAFETARARDMVTVGLAGYDGGRMADCDDVDYLFVVDSPSVHRIQEAQTTVYHVLWELVTANDRR